VSILTSFPNAVRAPSPAAGQSDWRSELREAVRDPVELCRRLGLPVQQALSGADGSAQFPVFVPPSYLARIEPGDPNDPLLLQVMPVAEEADRAAGFSRDPVGDAAAALQPGVLKKYAGRALLIVTGACAVHCRYCFRRHFPYEESPHSEAGWDEALKTIAADRSITEIILSGGDPLTLVDERLATLVNKIAAIEHVSRLRVHTRLPVMIPARVTDGLVAWMTSSRLTPIMVIHANHAQELDELVGAAVDQLRHAGIMLLNQAVLLRGVNDSLVAQIGLCERLIEIGVQPYYLHQLDRVAGAAHFEVPLETGRQLIAELRARLPGYAVPRYVQEIPGESSKTVLA